MINLLVTSVGRKVHLVRQLRKCLEGSGGKVLSTDCSRSAAGLYVSDGFRIVCRSADASYLDELKRICEEEDIDWILPVRDEDLLILSEAKPELEAAGVGVLVSPPETVSVCWDKLSFFRFGVKHGLSVIPTFDLETRRDVPFPCFVKPRWGSAAEGGMKVTDRAELEALLKRGRGLMAQRLITGAEYTADCFADWQGKLRAVVVRKRVRTRAGQTDVGETVVHDEIERMCFEVAGALELVGAVNMQFIDSEEGLFLLEVNPRFSGGIAVSMAAGVDFCGLTVDMLLGKALPWMLPSYELVRMLSYEEYLVQPAPEGKEVHEGAAGIRP